MLLSKAPFPTSCGYPGNYVSNKSHTNLNYLSCCRKGPGEPGSRERGTEYHSCCSLLKKYKRNPKMTLLFSYQKLASLISLWQIKNSRHKLTDKKKIVEASRSTMRSNFLNLFKVVSRAVSTWWPRDRTCPQ